MTQSESVKKPSSLHVNENAIVYVIAAVLLLSVWIIAFLGWDG